MKSIPFAESPSEPTPNQLRTTSSSAIVAPPSIVTVVCFTGAAGSPLPALNVTMYFVDCGETFAMRTSLCHCDAPARCPADGITNEPAAAPNGDGVTGVTRLTLTGIDVACETSVCARLSLVDGVLKMTMTVPVHVPLTSPEGSTEIVIVMPSGGTMPTPGVTAIHGLSLDATNVMNCPGTPGMKSGNVIFCVLPAGALTLTLRRSFGSGSGTTTIVTIGEYAPAWPQASARTR